MIPILSFIIAAYVGTRMIEIMVEMYHDKRPTSVLLAFFAVITFGIAMLGSFFIYDAALDITNTTNELLSNW